MWAPRGDGRDFGWLTFRLFRSESLERQQDRVTRIADELEVFGTVTCVALLCAPGFTECLASFAVCFPTVQIGNRFVLHISMLAPVGSSCCFVRQWSRGMAPIS